MKRYNKIILSIVIGAIFLSIVQCTQDPHLQKENKAVEGTSRILEGTLTRCEVFFAEDMGYFETQINNRIKYAKLIHSNILWSETTKNIGYYALICY